MNGREKALGNPAIASHGARSGTIGPAADNSRNVRDCGGRDIRNAPHIPVAPIHPVASDAVSGGAGNGPVWRDLWPNLGNYILELHQVTQESVSRFTGRETPDPDASMFAEMDVGIVAVAAGHAFEYRLRSAGAGIDRSARMACLLYTMKSGLFRFNVTQGHNSPNLHRMIRRCMGFSGSSGSFLYRFHV